MSQFVKGVMGCVVCVFFGAQLAHCVVAPPEKAKVRNHKKKISTRRLESRSGRRIPQAQWDIEIKKGSVDLDALACRFVVVVQGATHGVDSFFLHLVPREPCHIRVDIEDPRAQEGSTIGVESVVFETSPRSRYFQRGRHVLSEIRAFAHLEAHSDRLDGVFFRFEFEHAVLMDLRRVGQYQRIRIHLDDVAFFELSSTPRPRLLKRTP